MKARILLVLGVLAAIALGGYYAQNRGNPRMFSALPPATRTYPISSEASLPAAYDREIKAVYDSAPDGKLRGAEKVPLHYRAFVRPNEVGAVVISSGRTESLNMYQETIYDLYRNGYSVYIHDHRGQGKSGRLFAPIDRRGDDESSRSHVDRFENYVEDLHAFVTQVVKPAEHKRLFLLAHSMGGGIGTLYLEKYKHDFTAAALVTPMEAPAVVLPDKGFDTYAVDLGPALCSLSQTWVATHALSVTGFGITAKPWTRENAAIDDVLHAGARRDRKYEDPDHIGGVTHGWFREACRAAKVARTHSDAIEIPVLLLQASRDTAVSNRAQKKFCDGMRAGLCKGYVVEGAFHAILIDKDEYRTPAMNSILQFFEDGGHKTQLARQNASRR